MLLFGENPTIFVGVEKKEGRLTKKIIWKIVEIIVAEVCPIMSHVCKDTAENERFGIYGIFERQKSVIIYQKFGNLKFKYRNREFWCRGYCVDTVGKNTKKIKEYIANQLSEDKRMEQMSLFEVNDPFAKDRPVR